ncbi:MAG: hypothetical protein MUF51_02440, partial [Vicinamibacteria bacterium]|nr:hypothetical protein [Vicinamibacteria bacterium]
MSLSRAQIACLAAVAATCVLTIFGAQILLTLGVLFFLARLVTGQTTFPNLPVDAPILAFIVWTLLSSSFSADPGESFRTGNKKLVLFILIYIAVDSLVDETWRERILAALLLGGAALSLGLIVQYHLLGFDTLDHRPTGFLGHWMTASGLIMASLVMAVARLLSLKRPLPRPAREDIVLAAGIVVCMLILTLLRRLDLFSIEADRLFIIGVVLVALRLVIDNERWPGPATAPTLAWLVVPIATWALLVSQSRSAWLGVVAGLTAVAVL